MKVVIRCYGGKRISIGSKRILRAAKNRQQARKQVPKP